MTCPQCSSSDVRRSRESSSKDVLQSLLGRQAFRCRKCRHRYFAFPSRQFAVKNPDGTARKIQSDPIGKQRKMRRVFRRIIQVAVIVVMLSLFGFFLHYITGDHVPKSDAQDMGSPNE